jgi:hypothetical protein
MGSRARVTVRALAVAALASLWLLPGPARATNNPEIEFTIRPANPDHDDPRTVGWLVHRADAGEGIRDAVIVENLGRAPLDLIMYAADAATTPTGEFALEPIESADEGVSSWITLGRSRVSLRPGERQKVPVTIRVPENATPGDHPGGVVARLAKPVGEGPVGTVLAVGTRLYLRVTGELVYDLHLRDFRVEMVDGFPRFVIDMENEGNTVLSVTGGYGLSGWLGIDESSHGLGRPMSLVPGARVTRQITHPDRLFGGRYAAQVRLVYGEGRALSRSLSFYAPLPWVVFVAAAGLIATGAALALRALQRRLGRRLRLQPVA